MIAPACSLLRVLSLLLTLTGLVAVSACGPSPAHESGPASAPTPADDSAEAGFARDMATHHAQAVDMAFPIRDATTDERLRTLGADIIVTQSAQRGMFMAWLQMWGLPQASAGPRMAWMTAAGSGDHAAMQHTPQAGPAVGLPTMMGMASDAELEALRNATGRGAEILFLQLMIRHHEGGVLMARALLARSNHDVVVTLARSIENGQTGEIETMTALLADREAQPLPSLLEQDAFEWSAGASASAEATADHRSLARRWSAPANGLP